MITKCHCTLRSRGAAINLSKIVQVPRTIHRQEILFVKILDYPNRFNFLGYIKTIFEEEIFLDGLFYLSKVVVSGEKQLDLSM